MNYSPEEFSKIIEAVEAQGGMQLPDVCKPEPVKYTKPPYAVNHIYKNSTGCWNESRFAIPYDSEPGSEAKIGVVTVCAVDDDIALWPRFKGVIDVSE